MKEIIDINSDALGLRRKFGEDANSPIDIFSLLSNSEDLTIVFYPMSERISGICIKDKNNKIIAINSKSTYGRQRFTAAHELCHLYFHNDFNTVVCTKDLELAKDSQEIEADKFASYFLAPYEALKDFIENNLKKIKGALDISDVVKVEQHYGLSRQATLLRLESDGYISKSDASTMKCGIIRSAFKLGYDDKLYTPSAKDRQYFTFGKYIEKVEKLNSQDLISSGKYDELLLDAFRGDIVYGLDTEGVEIYD